MIERIDRLQIVVADRAAAAATYARILGAELAREDKSGHLAARRTVMALGESEIELLEPDGTGPVGTALAERGEGLFAGGVATRDLAATEARLRGLGLSPASENGQLHLEGRPGFGARFVVSPLATRDRVGPVSFLYEVTVTLVGDWRAAAGWYSGLFGLDPGRFSPIESKRFGYKGTLTLFDPPSRLDRIELSQVVDAKSPMGRWIARRGDSLYMAYIETHDLGAIIDRLDGAGARWTPRAANGVREGERDGLWVHPSALHGLLLGVSRTTLAWEWSGRPDLVQPRSA